MNQTSSIVHIAGAFDRYAGQNCILCGRLLVKGTKHMVEEDLGPEWSWPEGGLILKDGSQWHDTTNWSDKDRASYPMCTPSTW